MRDMASPSDRRDGGTAADTPPSAGDADPVVRAPGDPVSRAQSVVATLRAAADRIEADRALPADVVAALNKAKLFRLMLPRSLGGDEAHLKTLARAMEIIAEADASTAWCLGQAAGCAMSAAYLKPEVARRLFGPADAVLAWGAGIQGRAVAVDGGYRVTGKWTFASGCANATLLGGHSYVFNADGTPRTSADGRHLDRTALFVKSKARIHDMWHTLGLRGTASYTYEVDDLFVPEEETIDRDKAHERVAPGDLFIFPTTHAYATAFSALMLGIAQGMVRDLAALASTKTPRGLPSSLMESPVFQSQLAVLEARLRSSRAYLHNTIDEVWDRAVAARELALIDKANLKLASTYVITEGVDIATEAYRAAGQTAIFPIHPFERRLRDAHSASQQLQGRPANFVTIGRVMLGLPPDSPVVLG
jgi:indole-3-acetate monooxygenase